MKAASYLAHLAKRGDAAAGGRKERRREKRKFCLLLLLFGERLFACLERGVGWGGGEGVAETVFFVFHQKKASLLS